MKISISAIKHAHFLGIFACALFAGSINAYVCNISLLEKDEKKVVLFSDRHIDTPESAESDLKEVEAIIQEVQKRHIHTHWFLEWNKMAFKYQEHATGMNVFFRNAFNGKYDNPYTIFKNFDLRSLNFIFLLDLFKMSPEELQIMKEIKSGESEPTSETSQDYRRFILREKAHTREKYILGVQDRTQEMANACNELTKESPRVANYLGQMYQINAEKIISALEKQNLSTSLYDTWINMTRSARVKLFDHAWNESSLYIETLLLIQILNTLKNFPATVVFVYAGQEHCKRIGEVLRSLGYQDSFKQSRGLNSTSPLHSYKKDVLNFIGCPQPQKKHPQPTPADGITIEIAPAPAAPSRTYKTPISVPQPSLRPVQQSVPGARIETAPRYYPTDPYKKALDDALRKSIK